MAYPSARPVHAVPRSSKAGTAFAALKRDIMLGTLPAGTGLTELDLASHFGCSQGTVREALLQLQEEGLVQRRGHRGTQVSDCTEDEALEMFRLRDHIELAGLPRVMAAPSHTLVADLEAMLAEMVGAAEAEDELALAAIDRDFHRRILQDARLSALDPILHRCLVHNHRFKISRSLGARDLAATAMRHRPLIDAIAGGDVAAAILAMRHHIATIVDLGPDVFPGTSQ